jgi:Alpha/beta hydrolase family
MIEDARGRIDYDVCGDGPTIVLVPGSCSTGAAWRPLIAAWKSRFRCVTTSLLGYGTTAERRTPSDPSIRHEADVVEAVRSISSVIPSADSWRSQLRCAIEHAWQASRSRRRPRPSSCGIAENNRTIALSAK